MPYTSSSFVALDVVISEWSRDSREHKAEILRRICEFGRGGLIFDRMAFRRSDGVFLGAFQVLEIANLLWHSEQLRRNDAQAALTDVKIASDAVRDFCRATGTRLPDAVLGYESRANWLNAAYVAPPARDPTVAEIGAAEALIRARKQQSDERAERRRSAGRSLSSYPALSRPGLGAGHGWTFRAACRAIGAPNGEQRREANTRAGTDKLGVIAGAALASAPFQLSVAGDAEASKSVEGTNIPADTTSGRTAWGGLKRKVPIQEMEKWYMEREAHWPKDQAPPSRKDDERAAAARFNDHKCVRDAVRKARAKIAPHWQVTKRKIGRKNSAGQYANVDGQSIE